MASAPVTALACQEVHRDAPEVPAISALAESTVRAIRAVEPALIRAFGTARFRKVMDEPSLQSYAQQAVLKGYALSGVARMRTWDAPSAPVPGKANWAAAQCGESPADKGYLRYETRDNQWVAITEIQGPLLADRRERGRLVLALDREDSGWRIADLSLTRATWQGRDAWQWLQSARTASQRDPEYDVEDGWAAWEAWRRAQDLAFVGHRFQTAGDHAAATLKTRLPRAQAPTGSWQDADGEYSLPFPARRIVRHPGAIWPELRVEYLSADPDFAAGVQDEADAWMEWLRASHPRFLEMFDKVRFAPLASRTPWSEQDPEAEVRTIRPVAPAEDED